MEMSWNGSCRIRLHLDIYVNTMLQEGFMDFLEMIESEGYNFVNFSLNVCYCSPDIAMKIMWSDKEDFKVSDYVTNVNNVVNSERVSR